MNTRNQWLNWLLLSSISIIKNNIFSKKLKTTNNIYCEFELIFLRFRDKCVVKNVGGPIAFNYTNSSNLLQTLYRFNQQAMKLKWLQFHVYVFGHVQNNDKICKFVRVLHFSSAKLTTHTRIYTRRHWNEFNSHMKTPIKVFIKVNNNTRENLLCTIWFQISYQITGLIGNINFNLHNVVKNNL